MKGRPCYSNWKTISLEFLSANVQEIIKTPPITAIPNTPEFFKGVINLRDRVIPVLGLGEKLGFKESDSERPAHNYHQRGNQHCRDYRRCCP